MPNQPITPERILDIAEEHLRVLGGTKLTMVGIAQRLHVSHAALYRHFDSKAALLCGIAKRWLNGVTPHLRTVADQTSLDPWDKLSAWFHAARALKLEQIQSDPELFAAYAGLAHLVAPVVESHVAEMLSQITDIIVRGIESGSFRADIRADELAETLWWATARFHNPKMLAIVPTTAEELDRVLTLCAPGILSKT